MPPDAGALSMKYGSSLRIVPGSRWKRRPTYRAQSLALAGNTLTVGVPTRPGLFPDGASSSSYPDGHIDDLAAQVGNVLADVFGTELVCRTVEILRQLHADVVRAWLRAPVA